MSATSLGSYRGCNITRTFPSGMYESYTGETFRKADTARGIRDWIDEDLGMGPLDIGDGWVEDLIEFEERDE